MNAEVLEASFGSETIRFSVVRRVRKTLSISVLPDQRVEVVAPEDASSERIIEKVRKRAPWICKQLRYYDQFQPKTPERRYIGGETHLYLGRQYKLKVVPGIQNAVKMQRGRLMVLSTKPSRSAHTRELVRDWMLQRAQIKFAERLDICRGRFPDPEKVVPNSIIIRELNLRWGSMTGRRNLILNRALIGASTESIDYVITHELCHIPHPHHGPAFFGLLAHVMPEWEERKLRLERQLA
ncbi:M48 family metallopeptidase [Roseicyclus marinus]|uniref:M48 family metallopeptidase n=1 Tax=Roseicyclus marinus TaxID=2161673 RepID=UPI00240F145A|nr:SprT family zinc-dependent metalloprotease [Roseicyclus marinus]MDG3040710.1 SprT family zinc-dependent metalloprotease [Roseicyclus marinus]